MSSDLMYSEESIKVKYSTEFCNNANGRSQVNEMQYCRQSLSNVNTEGSLVVSLLAYIDIDCFKYNNILITTHSTQRNYFTYVNSYKDRRPPEKFLSKIESVYYK